LQRQSISLTSAAAVQVTTVRAFNPFPEAQHVVKPNNPERPKPLSYTCRAMPCGALLFQTVDTTHAKPASAAPKDFLFWTLFQVFQVAGWP
jgi:hypothetical protein